jgi:catechol 2,3-dioxygenase-like lactoylglutathione lyase family enzyme
MPIRYVHTNLVARDWRRLATFYTAVFGCEPVWPERDQRGDWLDHGSGVAGATIRGVHLRLPGYGVDGPSLEVYSWQPALDAARPSPNRPGLGHLAFAVDDVGATCEAILSAGGTRQGEIVTTDIAGVGRLTFAYMRDPEGNILEVQKWGG